MNCEKCGSCIVELNLLEEERLILWSLLSQDLKLFAVKKLIDLGYSHANAKRIISHMSSEPRKCSYCKADLTDEENISCPNCSSFNYNKNLGPPFNQNFCSILECRISEHSEKNSLAFWCDGIDYLPGDILSLSKGNITRYKEIRSKAWAGTNGQEEWEIVIGLGEKSIASYLNNESIEPFIPVSGNWLDLDVENKVIKVSLN